MIILLDVKKTFDKNQISSYAKSLGKTTIQVNFLNIIKANCHNPTAYIKLNEEKFHAFLLKSEMREECLLHTYSV